MKGPHCLALDWDGLPVCTLSSEHGDEHRFDFAHFSDAELLERCLTLLRQLNNRWRSALGPLNAPPQEEDFLVLGDNGQCWIGRASPKKPEWVLQGWHGEPPTFLLFPLYMPLPPRP